jgi:outer membrane lipoprotein-sorting protein
MAAMLTAAAPGSMAQDPAPDVQTLLQQMVAAYSEVQSYTDHSSAKYSDTHGAERLSVDFRIWFARPQSFRIDAVTRSPNAGLPLREVMWTDGSAVRLWATDKPVQTRPKVQIVGSRMFGTYAYHVPTLLEESYGTAHRLHELESPKVVGEDDVEGVGCYRVHGIFNGDSYDIWIGKADHFVHRIHAKYRDHELEEIHRDIAVNQPITLAEFRFHPEDEVQPTPKPTTPSPAPKKK